MFFPDIEEFATREVVTVEADAPVRDALARMNECGLRNVVVTTGDPDAYGILTANDLIRLHFQKRLDQPIATAGFAPLPSVGAGSNILEAIDRFGPNGEHICVVDGDGLLGIVSYSDIVDAIDPQVMIERQQVGDLIVRSRIREAPVHTSLSEVFADFEGISDAVVLLDGNEPAGILTTRDAVRLIDAGVSVDEPAAMHMSRPLRTIAPEASIREALEYLRQHGFKRLVVREPDGRLLGVITQRELITLAYSRWAEMMRRHALELREVVSILERRTAKLEQIANTDSLTGVHNRAFFDRALHAELERLARYDTGPFALMLIDIDRFKTINDCFGHLRGDEVLKGVAALIRERLRSTDVFARWGGEEFAILLPHTTLEGARVFAERLRKAIAATDNLACPVPITASFGLAESCPGDQKQSLIERADRALYRAKHNGRNRVEASDKSPVSG